MMCHGNFSGAHNILRTRNDKTIIVKERDNEDNVSDKGNG